MHILFAVISLGFLEINTIIPAKARFIEVKSPSQTAPAGLFKALRKTPGNRLPAEIRRMFPPASTYIWSISRWGACLNLKGNMEERAQELALYIIENKTTVRAAASRFGISKSTVHKDLSERLPVINRGLYRQVKEILNENKAERHIRGGIATRKKYKGE